MKIGKYQVMKMCGSNWAVSEYGLFVDEEIVLSFGWDTRSYRKKMNKNMFGIFWWEKR